MRLRCRSSWRGLLYSKSRAVRGWQYIQRMTARYNAEYAPQLAQPSGDTMPAGFTPDDTNRVFWDTLVHAGVVMC